MEEYNYEWDVLLVSPWTVDITVSQSFHIIRQEVERCSDYLYQDTTDDVIEQAVKYYDKIPISTGLLSIASVLLNNNYRVKYISLDYYKSDKNKWIEETLAYYVKKTKYMVCVTSVTPEIYRALTILKIVKSIYSDLITVIGGPHVSVLDCEYARYSYIDYVSRGEGEYTILELLDVISGKQSINIQDIEGLTYVENEEIIRTQERKMCDLASLPDAAYDLLPKGELERFKYHTYFSRGCFNNCKYCVEGKYWGNRKRFRTVDSFVNEIEKFCNEYNWKYIHIFDSDFIEGNEFIEQICDKLIEKKLDVKLSINVSPRLHKLISKCLLEKMVRAGFQHFLVGCETADDELLKKMNRNQTFEDLFITTKLLKAAKVTVVSTYWIIGLPGETRRSLLRTIEKIDFLFSEGLIDQCSAKMFVPYPGTNINDELERYNIKLVSNNWEEYDRYNFPPSFINEDISSFELYEYVTLIHAMQLSHYLKRTGRQEESYKITKEIIANKFEKAKYL